MLETQRVDGSDFVTPPQGESSPRAHPKHLKVISLDEAGQIPATAGEASIVRNLQTSAKPGKNPAHLILLVDVAPTNDSVFAEKNEKLTRNEARLAAEDLIKLKQELVFEKMFRQDHIPVRTDSHELTREERAKFGPAKLAMVQRLGGAMRAIAVHAPEFLDGFIIGAESRTVLDRALGGINSHRLDFKARTGLTCSEIEKIDHLVTEREEVWKVIKNAKQNEKREPIPSSHSLVVFTNQARVAVQ